MFNNPNLKEDLINLRDEVLNFSMKFESMHWLDCHRFINNDLILNDFIKYLKEKNKSLKIRIHSTSTLYGNEENYYRRHIKPECDYFLNFLENNWKKDLHFKYFDLKEKSMENHFLIISKFEDFDE